MHYEFILPLSAKSLHISFESEYIGRHGRPEPSTIYNASQSALGIFKVCECRVTTLDSNRMIAIKRTMSEAEWATAIEENNILLTCLDAEIIEANAIIAYKKIEAEKLTRSYGEDADQAKKLNLEADLFLTLSNTLTTKLHLHKAMAKLVYLSHQQYPKITPSFQL